MDKALAVKVEQKEMVITMDDIKKYIAPKATDKELFMFMGISKSYGLNPFKREIHFVKYGDNPASIIVGYEQYLKRADRTGKLDGWSCWIEDSGKPTEKAVIEIRRKDQANPIKWEVFRKEFDKNQSTWKSMPTFMLKKVAIAQGFRLAFPDELGGMPYIPEEMPADKGGSVKSEDLSKEAIDITPEETTLEAEQKTENEAEIIDGLKKTISGMMKGFTKESKVEFFNYVIESEPTVDKLQKFIDRYDEYKDAFMKMKVA